MMSRYEYYPVDAAPKTNTLGVAGFICSLVGLFTGGHVLSPVGLVLSLIALGRQPRGFAIAGLILGLVGTCGWLVVFIAIGGLVLAFIALALGIGLFALNDPEKAEITLEMGSIAAAVEKERDDTGYLPAAITSLGLDQGALEDPWGNPYIYTFLADEPGYDIVSHGKDGTAGTSDDIKLSTLGDMWKNYFQASGDDENGTVTLRMGDRSIVIRGDKNDGNIKVDAGDRIFEINGHGEGGHVTVTPTPPSTQPLDPPHR